jgi:hypothetical protein
MKKYIPFFESTRLLQEKWIKEFQQLNKYDQQYLRDTLNHYKIDIENTDFKVFDPLKLNSRAPEWTNPGVKLLFLTQTIDEETGKPNPLSLLCMCSGGKIITIFHPYLQTTDVFVNYNNMKVQLASSKQGIVDVKYLPRKEIIRISKFAILLDENQIKSNDAIRQQRSQAKSGIVHRNTVIFNPKDNKYYHPPKTEYLTYYKKNKEIDPLFSIDRLDMDKSGFISRKKELQNKLAQYRKEKLLSVGEEKIINDSILIFQKLRDKISLHPGMKKIPKTMDSILYTMRSYSQTLSDYFEAIENSKTTNSSLKSHYENRIKNLLVKIKQYTKEMEDLYNLS